MESEPELRLHAKTLITNFKKNEYYTLEIEKIMEIEGVVKEINNLNNQTTVILEGGTNESSFVICEMETDQSNKIKNIKPKDTIRLKGVFKGFLKDAIFLHCVISKNKIDK